MQQSSPQMKNLFGGAPGGFDYWQMVTLLEAAARRARIVGCNLAELMPSADSGGRGALVAARLLATIMGLAARQIAARAWAARLTLSVQESARRARPRGTTVSSLRARPAMTR